jgi:plasmid maintenance system antidote protein VapI
MEIVDYVRNGAIHVQIKEGVCAPPGRNSQDRIHGAPGVGAYALTKALGFPGVYKVIRGDRAISADTAVRLGKYFVPAPAQFWLNLRATTISDLQRVAESAARSIFRRRLIAANSRHLLEGRAEDGGPTSGSSERRCPARRGI